MAAKVYDVLIIGSGASGGMAAHTLTQKGGKCLMLDAGPPVDFNRDRSQNPTMTILSLSMRASEHIAGQMRASAL